MGKRKPPPWSAQELAILDDIYPREGINGAADALADRSWHAIEQKAFKRGLKSPIVGDAPKPRLQGDRLEEAIRLREVEGWSFARIGATFGVSEASACNAVLIALCPRKGFTPAQRDAQGRLTPLGCERLRLALRKGMKGVDIQLQLGLSAGRIAEERRRYRVDLKERGKAPLPKPGGGEAYSGVAVERDQIRAVEQLFLEGYGARKIHQRTGVSQTSIGRIRTKLIKRLARKKQCLPGCDIRGTRLGAPKSSDHFIPEVLREALRERILARQSVALAARSLSISGAAAHKVRTALKVELAARGEILLPALRLTHHDQRIAHQKASWLPREFIARFRALAIEHGVDEAKARLLPEIAAVNAAERARPKTFEDQLAAVRAGAGLSMKVPLRRPDPTMTLGGIASAAL